MKNYYLIAFFAILLFAACNSETEEITPNGIPYIETNVNSDTWVKVPAGEFLKGLHKHKAVIEDDFEIMFTNVTNAQYARYFNEALKKGAVKLENNQVVGYHPGDEFQGYRHEKRIDAGDWLYVPLGEPGLHILFDGTLFSVEKGFKNHPVILVTWFGAKAYADFYGWRLPTENEWEKAARGTDGRVFPWGDEMTRNQANHLFSRGELGELLGQRARTTPVGFYNGKSYSGYQTKAARSPYGLYDMAGNVWQWTANDYPKVHLRYMRGGSNANYEYNLRTWARNNAGPDYFSINVGFRCVRDVPETESM